MMPTDDQKREARRLAAECFLEGNERIEQLGKTGPVAVWIETGASTHVSAPLLRIAALILAAEERGRTEEREACAQACDFASLPFMARILRAGEYRKEGDHG